MVSTDPLRPPDTLNRVARLRPVVVLPLTIAMLQNDHHFARTLLDKVTQFSATL